MLDGKRGPLVAPGAQKGPKGPFWGHPRKKQDRQARSQRNFGRFTPWGFQDSCINGPATQFLPVAFGHFRQFPETRFGPGSPETGQNRIFSSKTQYLYGKRVTWVHSACPVHRSFWVRYHKCMFHLGPLGPEKRPKRPVSGVQREKSN